MKVIVCGGRDYADSGHVWNSLSEIDDIYGIAAIAHGGATGADTAAGEWAKCNGKPSQVFKARWKEEGKSARPKRNQRMLDQFKPDAVISFPGGRGTSDMVRRAMDHGITIIEGKQHGTRT